MKSIALFLLVPAACIGDVSEEGQGAQVSPATTKTYGYGVIGDSFAAGAGATLYDAQDPFAVEPYSHHMGYAQLYRGTLQTLNWSVGVDYLNLSVAGATTAEIISGASRLGFDAPQLANLVKFIRQHHNGVFVLVSGGGNDLLEFMQSDAASPCFQGDQPSCLANLGAVLDEAEKNLRTILTTIRGAGRKVDIAINTQVNFYHYLGCQVGAPANIEDLGTLALEGQPGGFRGLNDRIRDLAAESGANVLDLEGPFASNARLSNLGLAVAWVRFFYPAGIVDCHHPNDLGHQFVWYLLAN